LRFLDNAVTIVLLRHRESVWYCEEVKILPFKEADLDQGRSWVLDRGYANFGERCKAEVQLRRIFPSRHFGE
jgi:hypothetical protein